MSIKVELLQGGVAVRTERLSPDSKGNFVIPDVAPGTYDIAFKAPCWLREVVRNVTVYEGHVDIGMVRLVNGDADGDNKVTSMDLNIVLTNMDCVGDR